MEEDNYQDLYDYALRLLSFRPRSTSEIKTKLKKFSAKRNFPDKLIDKVIKELTEQKFLNDREFVRWWIEQRQLYRPKGLRAIKMELLQKGIEKETIEKVLSEDAPETASEFDLAMKVMEKKILYLENLPREKLKIKVRDLLIRRGFNWETVYKVIDSLQQKE